jgi:hypothetical protein
VRNAGKIGAPPISKLSKQLDPKERSLLLAIFTVKSAIILLEDMRLSRNTSVREIDHRAAPDSE